MHCSKEANMLTCQLLMFFFKHRPTFRTQELLGEKNYNYKLAPKNQALKNLNPKVIESLYYN
jgi:hypothetical protein